MTETRTFQRPSRIAETLCDYTSIEGLNFVTDGPVPHSDSSSNTLSSSVIERARKGDNEAFQRISGLYAGLVYHWCRKSGLSPEDAEDVGQQVFLSLSQNLSGFRREKPEDSFRGWMRVVTRSRIADHFRGNAHREMAVGGDSDWDAAAVTYLSDEESEDDRHREKMMLLKRAMDLVHSEFAEKDCQAFQLVVLENLTAAEVAAKLEVSLNSVYIAKSRILKRLRDEFGELLVDDVA